MDGERGERGERGEGERDGWRERGLRGGEREGHELRHLIRKKDKATQHKT